MTRPVMDRRVEAAQATLKHFRRKAFKPGRFDCGQMVAWHLRRIGRPMKVRPPIYHSTTGARRALAKLGATSLADLLDRHLDRIPWAAALAGDIVDLPAHQVEGADIGALGVVLGNGRVLVYHPDHAGAVVAELTEANTAWRVL
jgi:hypothetical protein